MATTQNELHQGIQISTPSVCHSLIIAGTRRTILSRHKRGMDGDRFNFETLRPLYPTTAVVRKINTLPGDERELPSSIEVNTVRVTIQYVKFQEKIRFRN